jgi:MFS family permease
MVIMVTRTMTPAEQFAAWGWRIPFLVSIVLLGVSLWIRLQLNESPIFQKMKEEERDLQGAAGRILRQVEQSKTAYHSAFRRRRWPGGGLVHGPILCALLP